jgi:flavoprotein
MTHIIRKIQNEEGKVIFFISKRSENLFKVYDLTTKIIWETSFSSLSEANESIEKIINNRLLEDKDSN